MITNTNTSKQPTEIIDIQKFIGVASVKIMAINPDNAKLRALGWQVPEGADEPSYVVEKTQEDGTVRKSARVRFMCQIQEFPDKPIVALDFWIRQNPWINGAGTKMQIIDQFGRTAWGTKDEVRSNSIPEYSSGPAKIALPYKPAHRGEEQLVKFLMKYLCCTPFETYDRKTESYVKSKNPGRLTIDDWNSLCNGDAKELRSYVASQPDNLLKVILGVRTTDDNKSYQTFIDDTFLANGARAEGGVFTFAQKAIDTTIADGYHDNCQFSAEPVKPFVITPTDVKPAETVSTMTDNVDALFGNGDAALDFEDDLPFGN